jgi:hypothetical protein
LRKREKRPAAGGHAMNAINVCALSVLLGAGPALSATCYRSNPAGGSIPYECVRGEELKVDAPGLGKSNLPTIDQRELDAIKKQMEGETEAVAPAVPAGR